MNKEILEKWKLSIDNLPKLKLNRAKKMYSQYLESKDLVKKVRIRHDLILGMLHIIANELEKKKLYIIESSSFDMNDIINTSIEYLINEIDKGSLQKINSFSNLFNRRYYDYLTNCLVKRKSYINSEFEINANLFAALFSKYLSCESTFGEVTREMFTQNVSSLYNLSQNSIDNLWSLFNKISKSINFDELNDLSTSSLDNLKYLFINEAYENEQDIEELVIQDCADVIMQKIYIKTFIDYILNTDIISDRTKEVLFMKYKLNNQEDCLINEIANKFNISRARVNQIKNKGIKKLRKSNFIRKNMPRNI